MEPRAGGAPDPGGSRGGRHLPHLAGPSARRLLSRLDARPLAARAAADMSALVRRAGATLRLRPKQAISVLDSADIEVTDSRLPHAIVEPQPQHCRSETLGTSTAPPRETLDKASCAWKPSQASDWFSVELLRGPTGFGLTLSGGRDGVGDAPLAVRGLLKDGPAQRCGHLQVGDLVLHINGESTRGLSHAQVMERIRAGGPRLRLGLTRPGKTRSSKAEGLRGSQKRDHSPDPEGPETRSQSVSLSPVHHLRSSRTPKTRCSPEPRAEAVAEGPAVPPPELRTRDPGSRMAGSPGPWLVPSEERLSRALGIPGAAQLAQEMAAGRRRH